MTRIRDDWHKPRKPGQGRLNTREIRFIKQEFEAGTRSSDVARELKCSSRTVRMHFKRFRDQRAIAAQNPAPKPDRFYRSTFEVSA